MRGRRPVTVSTSSLTAAKSPDTIAVEVLPQAVVLPVRCAPTPPRLVGLGDGLVVEGHRRAARQCDGAGDVVDQA